MLELYAAKGADFNEVGPKGDSLFEDILFDLCLDEKPFQYEVVKALLRLGADPNVLGQERSSPMTPAMLRMDTEMLKILLEAGADPNAAAGFTESELFYDWAEFDYRYTIYDLCEPDVANEQDKADEDSWLLYLDRMAIKHGTRRPDHLFLLRRFGAKSIREGNKQTEPDNMGDPANPPRPGV